MNKVLDLKNLVAKYSMNIKGVIHIGAHFGEENPLYDELDIKNRIFFEPLESNFAVLNERLGGRFPVVKKALGNENKKVTMFVEKENRGQSSSILKPTLHLVQYPHIKFDETEIVDMARLDDLGVDLAGYNFISVDVQGYELEVLKGASKALRHIDYIVSEINKDELYENGAKVEQLVEFLSPYGFELVEEAWAEGIWGDGLFVKKTGQDTLNYIAEKFDLDLSQRSPIEIPDFGRDQLAILFKELNYTTGVEIGVDKGLYSEILLKANPNLRLYGVDPFEPHEGYQDYVLQSTFDTMIHESAERLAPYPNYTFVRKYSMDAVKDFKKESIDFVYIDGDHRYDSVTNDMTEWSKRVKPGGIIAGHDYFRHPGPAKDYVVRAVHDYTNANNIKPWFILGRTAKDEGLIRDAVRSWMWVNSTEFEEKTFLDAGNKSVEGGRVN